MYIKKLHVSAFFTRSSSGRKLLFIYIHLKLYLAQRGWPP